MTSRPLELRLARGLFLFYCFGLVALNRMFAYFAIPISVFPIYMTELVMGLLLLLMAKQWRLWIPAFAEMPQRNVFIPLAGFILLAVIKFLLAAPYRAGPAARQSALAYYSAFAFIAWGLVKCGLNFRRFYTWTIIAAFVTSVLYLVTANPSTPLWFRESIYNYHGLGAIMWMGIMACMVFASGNVNFRKHFLMSWVFIYFFSICCLVSGRGPFLALLSAVIAVLIVQKKDDRQWRMVTAAVAVVVTSLLIELRYVDVIVFKDQVFWKQSWSSWGELQKLWAVVSGQPVPLPPPKPVVNDAPPPRVIPKLEELDLPGLGAVPITAKPPAKTEVKNNAVPFSEKDIYYIPETNEVYLKGSRISERVIAYRFSSKINNSIWRIELWWLALSSVLTLFPFFGFPLGINVRYRAFNLPFEITWLDLHNSHIAVMFRFGVVGFLLYATALTFGLRALWRAYRANDDSEALGYFTTLIFLMVLACFNVMWEGPFLGVPFWVMLGLGMGHLARSSQTQ